jgi:ADP-ribose pyrophosphatase
MPETDKPNGASLGWQRLTTDYPYTLPLFQVRRDYVRWPDGHLGPYFYVQFHDAVWVVPVTPDGQVVLIRQFRYTLDRWCWELPAGGFHDFSGTPVDLARQELAEEVGGVSENWLHVGSFRPGVSLCDMVCHIVLARDVRLEREPQPEPSEIIEVHLMPAERALAMARSGKMVDGHSALALLRCEPYLEEER